MNDREHKISMILARKQIRDIYGLPAGAIKRDREVIEQMHRDINTLLEVVEPKALQNWQKAKQQHRIGRQD